LNFKLWFLAFSFSLFAFISSSANAIPAADDINILAKRARLTADTFMQESFELRMKYEYSGKFLQQDDKENLHKLAKRASDGLQAIANAQKQLKLSECRALKQKNTLKNQTHTNFLVLQYETSVYEYYVELKENSLTLKGYFDLAKVPDLYIARAGQFLRKLRKENGLRQKDIAKIFNVSLSQVKHWENNENRMPIQQLVEIAEASGVSRNTIYLLIDQGKFSLKTSLPVKFERIEEIIPYLSPFKNDSNARITLRKYCPKETLSKINETLNVNPRTSKNHTVITCRELYNFLTTFFRYRKLCKLQFPLTGDVMRWYDSGINLRNAIICPCLQSDGSTDQVGQYYRITFNGKNKILHHYFVDAMYYEYSLLPTSYLICYSSGDHCTIYYKKSVKEIVNEIKNFAGNTKTSPRSGQTAEEYLMEPQPHLNYLMNSPEIEQQIALRIWSSTEGSISMHRKDGRFYPQLTIACAHPDLATQLQQIARQLDINFIKSYSKNNWSGIQGLSTSALSTCINFLKLGGFIKGIKISRNSKYHEGIDKDVLFLGILEFKKRELENSRLKKLPIQQVHYKINKIIENGEYKSAGDYVNYFS